MSHEIYHDDAIFSANGITPWHALPQAVVVAGKVDNTAEAVKLAGCSDPVLTCAAQALLSDGTTLPASMSRMLVRRGRVLASVGDRYTVLQDARAFEAFDPFVRSGVISLETAGTLRHGARMWILAKLAIENMQIGEGDEIAPYVLLTNSHGIAAGGPRSVTIKPTLVRTVCQNTLTAGLLDGCIGRAIRHDAQARTFRSLAAVELPSDATAQTDRVLDYLAAVWQTEAAELAEAKKAADVHALFTGGGKGSTLATADGTYWGLYNALADYVTHSTRTKGGAEGRAESSQWGTGADVLRRGIAVAWAMGRENAEPESLVTMPTATIENTIAARMYA